jgi:RES domain-containing protein
MQLARGRWNTQRPRIACLYTAYTRDGALGEYDKLAREEVGYASRPRDMVSLQVDVEPVLDLADPDLQRAFGITSAELASPAYTACHRVVRHAVLKAGFRAIRAPSAAAPGEMNLMIYPESAEGRLRYQNGTTRLAINYGPTPLRPRIA